MRSESEMELELEMIQARKNNTRWEDVRVRLDGLDEEFRKAGMSYEVLSLQNAREFANDYDWQAFVDEMPWIREELDSRIIALETMLATVREIEAQVMNYIEEDTKEDTSEAEE